ncbi:RnfH family protein [Rodentibacter caecimuris]|uniref:RnfH family protein n=1 Tax=Rodentibacter caecimuris TaxID=1796644 RepID=UPI0010944C52|nr:MULTISPECIES: RnfH family protein [Pasteurellaceae]MCQ9123134.1 RnfH family protein [Rodentibacter heylii]MCR1836842.1 RnfH family protein [Pasteurella caecimuris]MCU0107871.1 RnfH family protein [Pasteurella caecimuris]MCX2961576.1 RnfH family protein [Rodentibacter heylii]QIA76516.1 RnfH family protein [Rodentibacter heylii]
MNQINIEIAYALPDHYYLKSLQVEEGTMVQTAILQSGILQQFTDIDLRENKVGIFSRPTKLTDILKEGDRVEIYRPLLADPKEIRRKRAAEQAAQANKEKGVQK